MNTPPNTVGHVYRPDIDGLRTIAVLTVVFYHAEWSLFSGGFIGVDVFFVISGYLITGLLLRQLAAGTFTYGNFYIRRVRRLFPALFVTMAASFLVGLLSFSPSHLERFGGETIYALFSISNFYFWLESGYFDADAIFKPLLHTWSLSVEEQFYFVWPPFLALLFFASWQRWLPAILLVIVLASLVAAELVIRVDQSAVFYLMPFRMFEFGLGAAIVVLERYNIPRLLAIAGSLMAVMVILACSVYYTKDTLFPGLTALWPCLATAVLLHRSQTGVVRAMLSTAPFVFVGKISYSLYLVHWPIIVFYKYLNPGSLDGFESAGITVASICIAAVMYFTVEQRFRNPKSKWSGATLQPSQQGLVCVALAAFLVLPSATAWGLKGFPGRVPEGVRNAIVGLEEKRRETWKFLRGRNPVGEQPFKRSVTRILILGDSHAKDLFNSFHLNRREILAFEFRSLSIDDKCLYLFTDNKQPLKGMRPEHIKKCEERVGALPQNELFKQANFIIFTSRWELETLQFLPDLKAFLDKNGKPLILFDRATEFGDILKHVQTFGRVRGAEQYIARFIEPSVDLVNEALYLIANQIEVPVARKEPLICYDDRRKCNVFNDKNEFLYYDNHGHWSLPGAKYFGEQILDQNILPKMLKLASTPK